MLFIFSLAACKDSDENKTPDVAKFSEFSGDYLGSLMLSGNDALKNINVKVEGIDGVEKLKITLSKFKPETRAEIESVTFEAPAVIEGGKCKFEATNVEFASLKNMTLIGEIANKEIFIDGSYINEAGETVKLSFEGALDKEAEVEEATNFADFSGDYLGNLGFSEDQILKNINLNVVGVNGVKELTLTFSKLTNAADFEPVTVTVPARIEEGKCVFTVKDLAIGTLLNVELEGVIADKVLKLEGTSTVEGETVNLSFEGEIGKELVVEILDFIGTYDGVSYLTVSEITNKFSTTNVVVETTDKVDELSFTINNLKLANTPLTYKFNSVVSVAGMSANIAEQTVEIEGLFNVIVSGVISEDKELTLKFVAKDAQDLDVKFEFGVTKEEVRVVKKIAAWDFSNLIVKHENKGKGLASFIPASIAPFSWDSSDGGVSTLIGMGKASKFGLSDVADEDAILIETLDTKGSNSIFGFPATPKVTSGSLFLGTFTLNTKDPLQSTKFGVIIDQKVTKISGRYKYSSGQTYFECPNPGPKTSNKVIEKPGQKDEGILAAVIYDSTDETILNGNNVYTSDKVVFKQMINVADVSNYTDFNLVLDYDFDESKIYRLALIFSSSKDGDKFSGSPESKLWINDVNIFAEVVSYN